VVTRFAAPDDAGQSLRRWNFLTMGILDWFKNRPSPVNGDCLSDDITLRAIDKAVTLANPRLKLVPAYQESLAPAVAASLGYLRDTVRALPAAIDASPARWSADPLLRAVFVAAADIPGVLARSPNVRTLFEKYRELDHASFVLAMTLNEQRIPGMSLRGDGVQRDAVQTVISFSDHQVRICGQDDGEVRRLIAAQAYEYLIAQALSQLGEERSERRELEDNRALIRARLRLLQQQGPGLGSVFAAAPASRGEQIVLEAQLLENERRLEAMGSAQSALEAELEVLRTVLANPGRYIGVERKTLRLNTMNVVVGIASGDVAADVDFSLAHLTGVPPQQKAFVLARFARSQLPVVKIDFAEAARSL